MTNAIELESSSAQEILNINTLEDDKENEQAGRAKRVASHSLTFPAARSTTIFNLNERSILAPKTTAVPQIANKVHQAVMGNTNLENASPEEKFENELNKILKNGSPEEKNGVDKAFEEAINNLNQQKAEVLDRGNTDEMSDLLAKDVKEITHTALNSTEKKPCVNLALAAVNAAIVFEAYHINKINEYKIQGDDYKTKIDLMLKLSALLPKISAEDFSHQIKEETKLEIQKIHDQLKVKGIDIFPATSVEKEITKEQLAAANSLINHHIDQARTSIQDLFTTKISLSTQFMQTIQEVVKKMIERQDQAIRKMLQGNR